MVFLESSTTADSLLAPSTKVGYWDLSLASLKESVLSTKVANLDILKGTSFFETGSNKILIASLTGFVPYL